MSSLPDHAVKNGVPARFVLGTAIAYASFFLFHGLYLPYFPLWLQFEGLNETEIAIILALPMFLRVATSGQMSGYADRRPDRAAVLSLFFWAATLGFCLYLLTHGFWAILIVTLLFNLFWNPVLPVLDAITLSGVRRFSIDYGRVRIWGSIAFIIANIGGGTLLGFMSPEYVLWVMIVIIITGSALTHLIPRVGRATSSGAVENENRFSTRTMLKMPRFVLVLMAAGLIQASHALLYGFGSIYWTSLGLSGEVIGWLWALGVMVEIMVFQVSARLLLRISTLQFMCIGALAAMLRWGLFTLDQGLGGFIFLQVLHGLSFGAVHMATMYFIKDSVPEAKIGAAQGVGFVVGGISMAFAVLVSGSIYEQFGREGYWFMAIMAFSALIMLLIAMRLQPHKVEEGGETVEEE